MRPTRTASPSHHSDQKPGDSQIPMRIFWAFWRRVFKNSARYIFSKTPPLLFWKHYHLYKIKLKTAMILFVWNLNGAVLVELNGLLLTRLIIVNSEEKFRWFK